MLSHGHSGQRAYGQSKLAQIMFGMELAHRLPASGITVNSLHSQPHDQAFDPLARRELWQRSLELTRIPDPFALPLRPPLPLDRLLA